jgi:hypothetical protein
MNPLKVENIFSQKCICTGCWWLTPVIPTTQEAEIRRIEFRSQNLSQDKFLRSYLKKTHHKRGLVELLKV